MNFAAQRERDAAGRGRNAMSGWKVVPAVLAPEMREAWYDGSYHDLLSAAPAFEPDDAMVERALETFCCVGPTDKHAMRAALKAAFEVKP